MEKSLQNGDFRNGIAIVAGGSGGLGRAICEKLAASGVSVAFTYFKNKERAEETAACIAKHGAQHLAMQVNLEDEDAVADFISHVRSLWGPPATAIYAAGPPLRFKYISQIEPKLFRSMMDQDVYGFYNFSSAALPSLREAKGVLVALATPAVKKAAKKDILSVAPKAAIHAVVCGIAIEEGRFGVRANSVGVGLIGDAGVFESLRAHGDIDEKFLKATYEVVALQRLGRASEIAEAVAFLASERASFITGHMLMVDGGLST